MADVLARIAAEEHARVVSDGASALTVKPGPFLIAGIEIQQEQCVINHMEYSLTYVTRAALQLEAKRVNRTTIQATTLQRSRTLLLAKVKALHDVQDTYMPGLRTWITQQNRCCQLEAIRNWNQSPSTYHHLYRLMIDRPCVFPLSWSKRRPCAMLRQMWLYASFAQDCKLVFLLISSSANI
jgi:hypothetical protein